MHTALIIGLHLIVLILQYEIQEVLSWLPYIQDGISLISVYATSLRAINN